MRQIDYLFRIISFSKKDWQGIFYNVRTGGGTGTAVLYSRYLRGLLGGLEKPVHGGLLYEGVHGGQDDVGLSS
jgi:hypothetical protein